MPNVDTLQALFVEESGMERECSCQTPYGLACVLWRSPKIEHCSTEGAFTFAHVRS